MAEISDNKALQLAYVSTSLKRIIRPSSTFTQHDSPIWTEAFEKILAKLPIKDLESLELLLEVMRAAQTTGEFPS